MGSTAVPPTPTIPGPADEDVTRPVNGWPALAKLIADNPDLEAFPSFTDLNIKSLLYYQAELIRLRKLLHEAEYEDYRQPEAEKVSKFADDLGFLFRGRDRAEQSEGKQLPGEKPEVPKPEVPKQWVLIEKIRIVLEKYSKFRIPTLQKHITDLIFLKDAALLQYARVSTLRDADRCNVKSLRECVKLIKDGSLSGPGSNTWGEVESGPEPDKTLPQLWLGLITDCFKSEKKRERVKNEFQEHLIVPREGQKPDGLTLWVIHSLIPLYHRLREDSVIPLYQSLCKNYRFLCIAYHSLCSKLCSCGLPNCFHNEKDNTNPPIEGVGSSVSQTESWNPKTPSVAEQLTEYPGAWIVRATSLITTVVACLLPTVAITVLARVHGMGMILGLIALFTAVFAFGLVLLSSSSSRVEIFTATAA
jgi:hypothetical protein